MDNVTMVNVENEIERHAARRRELEEQRRALLERIGRADSARESVRESIYQKVRAEYEARLRIVEGELEPLASALEKGRASIDEELRQIDQRDAALRDELEELEFRHYIGEFDERAVEESRTPLEAERAELAGRRRELSETLSLIGGGETPAPTPEAATREARPATAQPARTAPKFTPAPESAPAPESTPAPEAAAPPSPSPGESASPEAPVEDDHLFIDPSEWLGEFLPDERAEGPAAEDTKRAEAEDPRHDDEPGSGETRAEAPIPDRSPEAEQEDAADPLANLADPGNESADSTHDLASPEVEDLRGGSPPLDLPILRITNGPGAGKKLPLLPVTMTLGREIDNNIELKDRDVARYHARISYESGKYVIQDIEGSPGTFVNGERVTRTALAAGDVIRVGNTELSLDLG